MSRAVRGLIRLPLEVLKQQEKKTVSLSSQVSLNTAYQAREVDFALKKVRHVLLSGHRDLSN